MGHVSQKARRQILIKSKPVESQTSKFCFVNWKFHCIIFKVFVALILYKCKHGNYTTAFRAEKLPGLSSNGLDGEIIYLSLFAQAFENIEPNSVYFLWILILTA